MSDSEPTPEQIAALQAMVNDECARFGRRGLRGKVRERIDAPEMQVWTSHWVIEVRDRDSGLHCTCEEVTRDHADPEDWREIVRSEISSMLRLATRDAKR